MKAILISFKYLQSRFCRSKKTTSHDGPTYKENYCPAYKENDGSAYKENYGPAYKENTLCNISISYFRS